MNKCENGEEREVTTAKSPVRNALTGLWIELSAVAAILICCLPFKWSGIGFLLFVLLALYAFVAIFVGCFMGLYMLCTQKGTGAKLISLAAFLLPIIAVLVTILLFSTGVFVIVLM